MLGERRRRRKWGGTNEGVDWGLYFYEWGEKISKTKRENEKKEKREEMRERSSRLGVRFG